MKNLRKILAATLVYFAIINAAKATSVDANTAQKVAVNFFHSISPLSSVTASLFYTEKNSANVPLYYVFNINTGDGFVIISADNILHPVIGYSTEKRAYKMPAKGTNIDFWMQGRKDEITGDLQLNHPASAEVLNEWNYYTTHTFAPRNNSNQRVLSATFPSSLNYLVQSTWDQPSPYNNFCPGGSVTGCVATTMCQIMRYWQYPSTGQGSSSYNSNGYGILSASYNHPYPWSAMPLNNPTNSDTAIARVMSDAGISVQMDYSPSGSGAFVLTADDPWASAQISYIQYFKYLGSLIDGRNEFHNQTTWQDTLEHEINCGRPIEYVGSDPSQGGHTWVCDGYDSANNFHMNWGWSGANDGWYSLNNLDPTGFNFSQHHEALIGIMPPPATAKPVAYFSAAKNSCLGYGVQFADTSSNRPTSWSWSFPGGTPSSSTSQNPVVTYNSTGTYLVKLIVSNSFGIDSLVSTHYITIDSAPPMPGVHQTGYLLSCVPNTYAHYQWFKNNVAMVNDTLSQVWINALGSYWVTASNAAGCSVTSIYHRVTALTGTNDLAQNNNSIKLYPNPNNGKFTIQLSVASSQSSVEIYNVLGEKIYSSKLDASTTQLDLSDRANGIYLYRILTESGSMVSEGKFIIQK